MPAAPFAKVATRLWSPVARVALVTSQRAAAAWPNDASVHEPTGASPAAASTRLTVPVGTPVVESTRTVTRTRPPKGAGLGVAERVVVVAEATIVWTRTGELEPAWPASPG